MWLQGESELVHEWSALYDRLVKREKADLPNVLLGEYAVKNVSEALKKAEFFTGTKKKLREVVAKSGNFADAVTMFGKDLLIDYCSARFAQDSDEFYAIYFSEEKEFIDSFSRIRCKDDDKESVINRFIEYRKIIYPE